jgi:CheY-like chemotaxis protein
MSVIKPALQFPDRIAYFEGANNYSWIYFRDGEKKLLAKPISFLEDKLPSFIRVHKTILINPDYVQSLHEPPRKKMGGQVQLDSGEIFPVSRRRWSTVVESIQNYQIEASVSAKQQNPTPLSVDHAPKSPTRSIFLITSHQENASMVEQIIHKKWPTYQFHTSAQSTLLPNLLTHLSDKELPALILLDARTLTIERMGTLQRLKSDQNLSQIPVILLVSPANPIVIEGYQQQANSVVSLPTSYTLFSEVIERICQFWLRIVRLPSVAA